MSEENQSDKPGPEKKKKKYVKNRHDSTRYMTLQQAADHYQCSESAIRKGCGPLKDLRTVKIGRLRLVLRSSVFALDRKLERAAVKIGNQEDAEFSED